MKPTRPLYTHDDLRPLFEPRSIAVIDYSSKPASFGMRTWQHLGQSGIRLYLVNPKLAADAGGNIHSSLQSLPEVVDCAIIAVPRDAVHAVVSQCAEAGVKGCIIYASGYAEGGRDDLRAMQQALTDLSRASGMRILGPNCMGIVSAGGRLEMTFAEAPPLRLPGVGAAEDAPRAASIGLVSQSGGLGFALAQAARHGCVFTHVLTAGNSCDVDVADEVAYLAADPACGVIALLFEGMPAPQRMLEAGELARRAGKPVVVCKLGTGEEGSQAAMSHTGSLAGSAQVYAAAFANSGFIVVDDFEALIETASFLAKAGKPQAPGVAALATSGGATIMVADKAEDNGVPMPQPGEAAAAILRSHIPEFGSTRNPCDVTAQILNNPQAMPACARAMLDDPAYGALVIPHPYAFDAGTSRLRALGEVAGTVSKPICIVWLSQWLDGPGALDVETHPRLCLFRSMDRCMRTLKAWHEWHARSQAQAETAVRSAPADAKGVAAGHIGTREAGVLTEREAKSLLAAYGIPVVAETLVQSADEACDVAQQTGFPVVLKIESPDVPHKTEAGGVKLHLATVQAVREAHGDILRSVKAAVPHAQVSGVLVQPMVQRDVELIIGARRDPLFGPTVLVGLGGVFVELLKDSVVALAPVPESRALAMLGQLRGRALLDGFRGSMPADLAQLARLVACVSELAADHAEVIEEIDVNPVVISRGQAIAVDALIALKRLP